MTTAAPGTAEATTALAFASGLSAAYDPRRVGRGILEPDLLRARAERGRTEQHHHGNRGSAIVIFGDHSTRSTRPSPRRIMRLSARGARDP